MFTIKTALKQRKGQASQGLTILLILSVLFILIYSISSGFLNLQNFKISTGALYSGGLVLSVSNVQVVANNSFCSSSGNCNVWEALIALTGQGEQLTAVQPGGSYYYPAGSQTNNGTTTKNLQINYNILSETLNYPVVNTGKNFVTISGFQPGFTLNFNGFGFTDTYVYPQQNTIYCYNQNLNTQALIKPDYNTWASLFESTCNSNGGYWLSCSESDGSPGLACLAINQQPLGVLYQLQTPNIQYSAQVTLNNGVTQEVLSLSQSQTSAISSDNNVYAIISNSALISPANLPITVNLPSVVVQNGVEHFISHIDQPPLAPIVSNGGNLNTVIDSINSFNGLSQSDVNPISFNGVFNGSLNNLTVVYNILNQPSAYPLIQLFVKADYLGIVLPRMVPVITSTSCPTFQGGLTGSLIVNVENSPSATQTGSLLVSATCSNGITVTSAPQMVTGLNPGGSGTATLQLSSPTSASSQCVVTVSDPLNPSNSVSSTVTCTSTNPCPYTNVQPPWIVNFPNSASCTVTCGLTSCSNGGVLNTTTCTCETPNVQPKGCAYNNPPCSSGEVCQYNTCVTPTPTQTTTTTQTTIPSTKQDYTIYIIIILIVAGMLAGLTYWYYYIKKRWFEYG